MTFNWLQYLNLAKELLGQPTVSADQNARYRAAIHLAYYAAFTSSRNYLRDQENYTIPKTVNAHKKVSEHFQISSDPIRQEIGRKLSNLRRERNKADYQDNVKNLKQLSYKAVHYSQDIISKLTTL